MKEIIFNIDHIDPMGQGVFKNNKDIYFIRKTLPKEEGLATVFKKTKGVHKAVVKSMDISSTQRTSPKCPHYAACPACHFLHCSYRDELSFKRNTLARFLKGFVDEDMIKIIAAPKRDGYRNRVQFHYDLKQNKIGYKDALLDRIVPVSHCLIISPSLKKHIDESMKRREWREYAKKAGNEKGHVEYFEREGKCFTAFNRRYAKGGFTQVNSQMNKILKQTLKAHLKGDVLELFSGNGNLTEQYKDGKIHCIDFYGEKEEAGEDIFFPLDLYNKQSLEKYASHGKKLSRVDTLLLNPPRSGFSLLKNWVDEFNPERVIYISCHPATMVRDLKNISGKVQSVYLMDLFPSTYHFEVMVELNLAGD
ncbi:MAG: hypothetical protein OXB84_07425 [Halobacteriovoraceae bacterium]|nr:hypothetical protein [Halobacteriovoraceae bacterium]